nr:MAG TPA: hypothetical protein [Caudoviricetes sp.]
MQKVDCTVQGLTVGTVQCYHVATASGTVQCNASRTKPTIAGGFYHA